MREKDKVIKVHVITFNAMLLFGHKCLKKVNGVCVRAKWHIRPELIQVSKESHIIKTFAGGNVSALTLNRKVCVLVRLDFRRSLGSGLRSTLVLVLSRKFFFFFLGQKH